MEYKTKTTPPKPKPLAGIVPNSGRATVAGAGPGTASPTVRPARPALPLTPVPSPHRGPPPGMVPRSPLVGVPQPVSPASSPAGKTNASAGSPRSQTPAQVSGATPSLLKTGINLPPRAGNPWAGSSGRKAGATVIPGSGNSVKGLIGARAGQTQKPRRPTLFAARSASLAISRPARLCMPSIRSSRRRGRSTLSRRGRPYRYFKDRFSKTQS